MDSEDQLGNVFSDEDSFDAPVPMSKSYESAECADEESQEADDIVEEVRELNLEEEDFDLITIEKVSMDVLVTRIGRIISEIMQRGEPAAKALFDVATKIVFQSTMLDSEQNTVIGMIVHGLTKIIVDVRERDERAERGEQILMLLVAKLAIKNKFLKCDDLLLKLIILIDYLYLHTDSIVRVRICRLIYLIVEESNRYTEAIQEEGDNAFLFTDGEPPEVEVMIPNGVKSRWMNKLAKSLCDKVPLVRCAAVSALSLWDYDKVYKNRNGDETSINDLLWRSLYDVNEGVRVTAARRTHIIGETEIDRCMNYVEMSKDVKVRQAIVIRLASDVHLFSLSEQQRFRLVNILNSSSSARVQDTIHQRLVDAWMTVAASELVCATFFPAPSAEDRIPDGFPSIILEYLDPLVDPKACYVFLKFATVRYIQNGKSQHYNSVDLEKFMVDLLALTASESECLGLMRRSTFRLVDDEENSLKKTYLRIFITRCFMDVVFQLSRGRPDVIALRNRALMLFVPDVTKFSLQLEKFCEKYFQNLDEPVSEWVEVLLSNIFHLINVSVKHTDSSFDKAAYKESLENLLENPELEFSSEIVVTIVTTIIDLCQNRTEVESTCEWICDTSRELLLTREDADSWNEQTLEGAMNEGVVQERMYFRSANMLLATCQHEEVREPSPAMSSLFKAMIPALLGNQNKKIQVIGLELIGFAAAIDFENCGPYLKLTRFLILRDDLYLKATGLNTLIRVIKTRGFSKTAVSIFESVEEEDDAELAEESLAKLIEKTVVSLHGVALAQAVRDCLTMLSYGDYAWPRLLSALLLIVFQKRNVELQLTKLFGSYCKKSIRSKWSKAHLLQSFTRAISVITKSSESDASWNLGEMTSVVCEHLSSVQTVGEEDDNLQMGDLEDPVHIEIEMATRMISRAVSFPGAWFVRHVFSSMATSLSLQCVPIKQLRNLHNMLLDLYVTIRFNAGKTTQIAVKRFIAHCEKMIGLYDRRHGLNVKVDLRKVKNEEEEDPDFAIASVSSSSSGGKRRGRKKSTVSPSSKSKKWDNDGLDEAVESDDSFEYFPKSTKTRKRQSFSIEQSPTPAKRPSSRVQVDINLDDSFEL